VGAENAMNGNYKECKMQGIIGIITGVGKYKEWKAKCQEIRLLAAATEHSVKIPL